MVLPMIYYLHEGKKIKFFTLVVGATLIQYIAIFSLFLIFLKRRFGRTMLLLGVIFALILNKLDTIVFIANFMKNNDLMPLFAAGYFIGDNEYMYDIGLSHVKML